jgi:hypothetical protein
MAPTQRLQARLDEQRRKVDVDHFDVTVRELVRMASENELDRAPAYQRKFRWSDEDESRLIESVFLGLPVPSLFVAANADGTWEVVDGVQRLSTLIHFVAEPALLLNTIDRAEPLRLTGLESVPDLNGLTYGELPGPLRLAFNKRALRVTALSDKSDLHVRFDLFERLNNGGIALTAQEVRACIYRGSFNDLLRELAADSAFKRLVKLQKRKQDDGTREEVVLKFFAYLYARNQFNGAVTDFLNDYMEEAAKSFNLDAGRDIFHRVITQIQTAVDGPFVREGYPNTPLNQLEAVMVAIGELIAEGATIVAPATGWLNDKELVRASTGATNTAAMLRDRIARAKALWSGTTQ